MRHFLRNIRRHDNFIPMCILSGAFAGFSISQIEYYMRFKKNEKMSYPSYFGMTISCTISGGIIGTLVGPILPELVGLGLLIYPIHKYTTMQLEMNELNDKIDKLN